MSGVRNKADDITEAISTGTCYIVLERFPPDYVQTVARYLESSVPQNNCDATRDDPKETESDSGDSVFITQKPVPEPVRSSRRHRKTPTSPKDLEESEDSSSSQNATTSNKKRKKKNVRLPKYTFPFVKEKQWMGRRSVLTGQQNKKLHNAMMGGFFKCVRELWHGYKGVYMDMSLPTVDMDGDILSPLSEEEEERSEKEDIKVVEKRFLAASKAMCTQAWYTPGKMEGHIKQQSRRRRASSTSQDVSQDQTMTIQQSTSRSITTATPLLSDKDGHPCRDLPQQENGDPEHEIHQKSIPGQTELSKTKRRLTGGKKMILFQKNEREEELYSDSDATVCDALQLHGSPSKHTQGGKEAVNTATQAQVDVFQMDELSQGRQEEEEPESQSVLHGLPQFVGDTNNVIVCAESTLKKKKNTVTQAQVDVFQMDELSQTRQEEEEPESQSVLHGLPQFVGDTNSVIVCAESTPKKKKKNTVTQAQADVFQIDELSQTRQEEEEPESQSVLQGLPQFVGDTNNVISCAESTLKKKKNTVTQAQVDVFQMDELSQTRQEEEEPESQSVLHGHPQFVGDPNSVIVCAESTPKKKKKNTVTQAQADVFQIDELSQTRQEEEEPESQSVLQGLPQFVGDTNNVNVFVESTLKKKKKKKKKKKNTVTQAQAHVFQIDELSQTRQEEEEPESQSVLQGLPQFVGDTNNVIVCAESTLKKKKNTVTQAQVDVFQMDELSQTRQEEEEPESQSVLHGLPQFVGDTNSVIVCSESTPKKKKKKKKNTVTQAQAHVFQIDELSQTRQEEEEPESQSVLQGLPQFVGDTNNVNVFVESTLKKKKKKKKKNTVTQAQADVFQMDELSQTRQKEEEPESRSLLQSLPQFVSDANNVIVCAESTPKKKKKKKNKNIKAKGDRDSVEEAAGQNQEEPEGLHAAESVNVEAEETFSRSDNNDNMSMQEKRLDSTQQKRKRKRGKLFAENIRQEVGEHLEPGVSLEESEASVMCNIENAKKIKKKKGVDDAEGVEQLESTEAATTKNDGQKKMKKLKHKSIKRSSSLEDNQCENDAKVRLSNEGATLEEHVVKKRKKESISQGVSISYTPDKSDKVECIDSNEQDEQLCKKKKKKRRREKFGELSNEQASKDTVAQSHEAVSVRKKEKRTTSSFLQADSGEKDVELHQQQNNSKTVAPGVCDFEAESAEIVGNSGDGVSKKKKRKRKTMETQDNVEDDQGTEFEEPNKMCRSVLTETGIKKRKKSKSKSVSMDRLDSAVDVGRFQAEEDMMQKKKKNKKIFNELKM
ncbi:phoenix isoform X2 [Betta splendens]|uniref:Phoenix isoform X2 n=1 Tax=Betta splendens TaxID=158456 RepID=A0A6P7PKQ0_BETSP|nr:phoenix isoform X2 [Betta splendens]